MCVGAISSLRMCVDLHVDLYDEFEFKVVFQYI